MYSDEQLAFPPNIHTQKAFLHDFIQIILLSHTATTFNKDVQAKKLDRTVCPKYTLQYCNGQK